ncbi:MAG: hypothetical protein WD066_17310 [Planctomycetaceae bacterium]
MLVPARSATHVVCDACHEGHVEEVVRITGGKGDVRFRICCPDAGWVEVPTDRLRQWTIDLPKIVSLMAEGLGLVESPEEIIPGIGWRIGTVEIAGQRYGIAFIRNAGTDLAANVQRLAQLLPPPRTIVVGIRELGDRCSEFAAAATLPFAFSFNEQGFSFLVDQVRSILSTNAIIGGHVFQLRGEMWILSYGGDSVYLNDIVGLGYIRRLLMEPNRDIPAVALLAARAGIDPRIPTGSAGEILDDEGRRRFGNRYRELGEELAEAQGDNDPARIEKARGEMEILAAELANAMGLGGRKRKKEDADRVRKSVSMAVSRAIDAIRPDHERLARHLDASISSGRTFRYAPEQPIDWLL